MAYGAELKSTFCLAKGERAWIGHHIGDLKNYETLRSFTQGVEHFEERRRRIAAEVHRHLVDLVEHEDGVAGTGLLHHLNDLARERANVGAAVAANLGFIAHAAQ